MVVLRPLFVKYPDNPGVVHYMIHSCDNPPMAKEGLAAADHYGEIAQDGPHAFHMPGHIYARLGIVGEGYRVAGGVDQGVAEGGCSRVRAGFWMSRTRMIF